jgi:2-polyprenyl-3-methyl-5-hydroxy-6-metoxy-1,4-benzoquinol methylase
MTASIEQVKEFWDNRPCNIRHSEKELGTREYYEEVEKKKFFVEPHILQFTNFPEWRGKKVLEIGCGLATVGSNFALHGADYTGVELSESSLDLAKKRFEAYNQKGTFYSVNAEELTSVVPIQNYDLIYSFGVIHHSPYPEKIISEIKKYMGENSVLKIMLYAKNSWKNYMIEAELDQPEAQFGCPIAFTYTKDEVKDLLKDYDVISIEQDHIFPYQIELYKQGEYIKQPWFESMPPEMFRTLEKNLGWHLLITAKLKK